MRTYKTLTITSLFTNHQPRSVPGWTQIPPTHDFLPLRTTYLRYPITLSAQAMTGPVGHIRISICELWLGK